jgi:L-ascorbate metabolism protein UlaG (beta-lactamase superfamily)
LALVAAAVLFSCASLDRPYSGPVSDHYDGRRFHLDHQPVKGLGDVLKWQLNREPGDPWVRDLSPVEGPPPPDRVPGTELSITFVNHATVLIQTGNVNLLTDPIWSERASPVSWSGPARYRPPGLAFSRLPPIDVVIISHNHYDHMDRNTIHRLRQDHDPLFIVPLGNCDYLGLRGDQRCRELDWWQDIEAADGFRITAVPVQHWSRRGMTDANAALWAGYVIDGGGRRFFFAGDTGMGDHFARIRERLGPPDLAILPIGAYLPRWFMAYQHIDPAEAVAAHRQLGARRSMAMHYGTFRLADEAQDQPRAELLSALDAAGLDRSLFWIPPNGERRDAAALGLGPAAP